MTNEGFSYDPQSDSWTAIENSTYARYRGASACGFYKIGGSTTGSFHPQTNPEVYPDLIDCSVESRSLTATDYSTLTYVTDTNSYTRTYLDGLAVHFTPEGRHDYTLEPDGKQTLYSYNPNGTLATIQIIPPGEQSARWTWTFNYISGKLSRVTDPAGRETRFTINNQGDLSQITTPDNATQHFAYDSRHLPTHYEDQNGDVTSHTFDASGRISSISEPPRTLYDPETGETEVMEEVRDFTPSETSYALLNDSPTGDPDNPAPPVPTSADLVDRVSYGRGGRSGYTNKWGSWLEETDAEGRTSIYERDGANNITRMEQPDGDCVESSYSSRGNRLTEVRIEASQCP